MFLPVVALHAVLCLAGLAVKEVNDLVSQRHRPAVAASPISSETLEIDIQAPIEVVLDYITNYNYLISDHDEDDFHDLHSWVLHYSPSRIWNTETDYFDSSVQRQQGRGIIDLASPCVVAVTSQSTSVDKIMNDIVKTKKNGLATKHYRSQKIPFLVCPHWQVNRHADKPNLWTKLEMMISVQRISTSNEKNLEVTMALLHNEFEPKQLPGKILDMILDGQWNKLTILTSTMLKWVKRSSESETTRITGEKSEQQHPSNTYNGNDSALNREKIEEIADVKDTLPDLITLQATHTEAENEDENFDSAENIVGEDETESGGEELDQQSADTRSELNGVDTASKAHAENLNSDTREGPECTDPVAETEKESSDEKQEKQNNMDSAPLNKDDEQSGADKNTVVDGGMSAESEDVIAKAFKLIHDYVDEANLTTLMHGVRPVRLFLIMTACLLLFYNIYLCLGACFMSRQKFVMRKSVIDDDLKSLKSLPSSHS